MQILTTRETSAKNLFLKQVALIFGILTQLTRWKAVEVQMFSQLQQGEVSFLSAEDGWG